MQLVKSSYLIVFVVFFAVVFAAPEVNVSAVSDPSPSVSPTEEKDVETTVLPTRSPIVPSETPTLVHASTPVPVEEKTTKAAATMQSAPEKSEGGSSKPEDQKDSATSHNHVYPLIFSTAAVVLLSALV